MSTSLLFGLDHSNHSFDARHRKSFGKNIFTNAFPIALACYMDSQGLGPLVIEALVEQGYLTTRQTETPFADLICCDPSNAHWLFENSYTKYRSFATGEPNRSDVVVADMREGYAHKSAFEIKLITVPNSATANRPREQQSCELVTRPPTIEQLCFSIVRSFGTSRRHDISDIISECLGNPMDYRWSDESYMLERLPRVVDAAANIAREGISAQHPFVLSAIWRTKGQEAILDGECFDIFAWTDMAFLQLFTNSAKNEQTSISRPSRSVIWLVKALFDYGIQGKVTFAKTHSDITFGAQTDKAASFTGPHIMMFMDGDTFRHPRVPGGDYKKIIDPAAIDFLMPERRLDGVLGIMRLLESYGHPSQVNVRHSPTLMD